MGKGVKEGERGNESYDRKKAWSSKDHSILSGGSEHVHVLQKYVRTIIVVSVGERGAGKNQK